MSLSKERANEAERTLATSDMFLIQVTCDMNAKGQTLKENI